MSESEKAKVFIVAGRSNTDGRVFNNQLPDYILGYENQEYIHCKWNNATEENRENGVFTPFWPRMFNRNNPNRWAYDAVTFYHIDQNIEDDFYVIKHSHGGTAIDTSMTSSNGFYWNANLQWLTKNESTHKGGISLLLSLEESIEASINNTLSKLEQGYEFSAILWHQGESDYRAGNKYYDNLKQMVNHLRSFIVEKTGDEKYYNLPFIFGTISEYNKCYNIDVENGMKQLAAEDENIHLIDMSKAELQKDRLHFTKESSEYLGLKMYEKLVELNIVP